MSGAQINQWNWPKNEASKVVGWAANGRELENKDWADPSSKQDASANLTTLAGITPGAVGLELLADVTADNVHDGLARDWSGATAGAPTLSLPNIMQRRYVDVGAYCSLTDTDDAHVGIQAAFDGANGREIVFTNPYGGTRRYRSTTRPAGAGLTTGALTMPQKGRIIMEPGALLDFSDWANSGNAKYLLYAKAADPTAINLASNAAIDTDSIVLASGGGASFAVGWHIIVSDADFTTEEGSLGTKGEWIYVNYVSTDTLTISAKLRDTYNTADTARVYPMTALCELWLENLNLLGCGQFTTDTGGDRGIWIENGINCRVVGGSVHRSDQFGVMMMNVLNGLIDGTRVEFDPTGTNTVNQYGVQLVNLCEGTKVINCDVTGGKEALGLTATGGIVGPTRDVTFARNRVRGAWRSGFATHDNHTGVLFDGNIVEDCEQGVDNRIVGGTYRGNIFRRMGAATGTLNTAFQLGSGAGKVLIESNTIEDSLRGVWMPAAITHEVTPGDIDIINNDMRLMGTYGALIENTSASTAACGTVTFQGNRVDGDGSTALRGLEVEGKWKVVATHNTFRNGNANRAIYLHATDNGAGTNGPVDPIVTDNVYDSTFTAPLIQHASGITKDFRNTQIGVRTSGDILRGSKLSQNFGSLAGSFGAFESTTVTVTGAAVGDQAKAWMNLATGGVYFDAKVTATDTVTVWAVNFTGSAIDLATGTLFAEVIKA